MTLPYPPSPGMGSPVPAMPTEPWPTAVVTIVPGPTVIDVTHAPAVDEGGDALLWIAVAIAAIVVTVAIAYLTTRAFYRRNP